MVVGGSEFLQEFRTPFRLAELEEDLARRLRTLFFPWVPNTWTPAFAAPRKSPSRTSAGRQPAAAQCEEEGAYVLGEVPKRHESVGLAAAEAGAEPDESARFLLTCEGLEDGGENSLEICVGSVFRKKASARP